MAANRMQTTRVPNVYRNDLDNGRRTYTVRYRAKNGGQRTKTFTTMADATTFEAKVRTERARGTLIDPRPSKVTLADFAADWLDRHRGRDRTKESYGLLLRCHILPSLGGIPLGALTPADVDRWYSALWNNPQVGRSIPPHAYRVLRACLANAVLLRYIPENPAQVPTGGKDREVDINPPPMDDVLKVADAIAPRFRAMVIVAATCGLRFGELAALERHHVNLDRRTLRVEQTLVESGTRRKVGPPKSEKGVRTITLPRAVAVVLAEHLGTYVGDDPDAFVFTGERGAWLARRNFLRTWKAAFKATDVGYFTFHRTRHVSGVLVASLGAPTKVAQRRMGHASSRAALHYQHFVESADVEIAESMDTLLSAKLAS